VSGYPKFQWHAHAQIQPSGNGGTLSSALSSLARANGAIATDRLNGNAKGVAHDQALVARAGQEVAVTKAQSGKVLDLIV
jgi:hypothetical protein